MTRRVRVRPQAEAELRDARLWYETRSTGLGDAMLVAFGTTLAAIERHPFSYAKVFREIRRAELRRFPYGIFYTATDEEIVVIAFFHGRRDPAQWMTRT